jgi:hypothetical protein
MHTLQTSWQFQTTYAGGGGGMTVISKEELRPRIRPLGSNLLSKDTLCTLRGGRRSLVIK